MNVSFNGTFGLPLISPNRIRSIDYQDDKIKDFITKIDNDIKGEKDISVYSPDPPVHPDPRPREAPRK